MRTSMDDGAMTGERSERNGWTLTLARNREALRWFRLLVCFFLLAAAVSRSPGVSIPVLETGVDGLENPDLSRALALLRQGKLDEAMDLVNQRLAVEANSPPALELKGVLLVLQGQVDAGLASLQRAVNVAPSQATAWVKIGDIHASRDELANAKACFQRALAVNPGDRHSNHRLGLILEDVRETAAAIEHLEKGLVGTPAEYVGVKVNLGSLYNQTRQYRRTVQLLGPVLGDTVANPVGHLVLGSAHLVLGETEPALKCFERAKRWSSEAGQSSLALGIAYRNAAKYDESLAELSGLVRSQPTNAVAKLQLGETLLAMKRLPEAITAFSQAAMDPETHVLAVLRQGEAYAEAGEVAKALERFESLVREGKFVPRGYLGMAGVYQRTDRQKEAEEVLQRAVAAFPKNPEVRLRLGMHLGLVGRYREAITVLGEARTLAPAEPRILKALALGYFREKEWPQAIETTRKLLELAPGSVGDHFFLGTVLEAAGKDAEARGAYERLLAIKPDDVATLNNLAMVLARLKELPRALEIATRAAELAPGEAVVWDTKGWIQYQAGQLPQARASLEKAVVQPRAKPAHRYHYAVVLERSGERGKAVEQLNLALSGGEFPEREQAEALASRLR